MSPIYGRMERHGVFKGRYHVLGGTPVGTGCYWARKELRNTTSDSTVVA